MSKIIFIITLVIASSAMLVIIYTWLFARFYCKPKKHTTKKTPLDYGLPAQKIQFYSQGKRLEGWYIGKNVHNKTESLVILAHGWSANYLSLLPFAKFLYNKGCDVLLYDSRGHGNSSKDGPITLKKMAQDIIAAIDHAYQEIVTPHGDVFVIGHCTGGSAAIVAASRDHRIDKIIACSPFADPKTLTTRYVKQKRIPMGIFIHLVFFFIEKWLGTKIEQIAPINRIKDISRDVLLMHGLKDQIVPYSDSVSLKAACSSNKIDLLSIVKRGHYDILRDSVFMNNAVAFIKRENRSIHDSHKNGLLKHDIEDHYSSISQNII